MSISVAVIAPGNMGASIGAKLSAKGADVATLLEGRSPATVARAEAAGMKGRTLAEIAECQFILSVLPPDQAVNVVNSIASAVSGNSHKPIFVECNALAPVKVQELAKAVASSGLRFVDGSIIGLPSAPDVAGPAIFVSGEDATEVKILTDLGLDIRLLPGPVGDASALKMCYGGLTKGLVALGSMMILGASRAGIAEALGDELKRSQPALYDRFSKTIPDMFSKAGRWVPEMDEISTFLGEGSADGDVFNDIGRLYDRLASNDGGDEIATLEAFFTSKD